MATITRTVEETLTFTAKLPQKQIKFKLQQPASASYEETKLGPQLRTESYEETKLGPEYYEETKLGPQLRTESYEETKLGSEYCEETKLGAQLRTESYEETKLGPEYYEETKFGPQLRKESFKEPTLGPQQCPPDCEDCKRMISQLCPPNCKECKKLKASSNGLNSSSKTVPLVFNAIGIVIAILATYMIVSTDSNLYLVFWVVYSVLRRMMTKSKPRVKTE